MEEIKSKIAVIQERGRRLSKFAGLSYEAYLKDFITKDAVERNIEVAIQACIDIAKIIIKRERFREPEDNKGIFVVLAENGIISEKSLKFLIPMAGTRNILIHGYDKIDDSIVFGIFKKHLPDFISYIKDIDKNYIEKKSSRKREKRQSGADER